jgi:hypothetical protein
MVIAVQNWKTVFLSFPLRSLEVKSSFHPGVIKFGSSIHYLGMSLMSHAAEVVHQFAELFSRLWGLAGGSR